MDHHIARDLLGAYVDRELEPDTRRELEKHLTACGDCRALVDGVEPEPAAVPSVQESAWDERRMRRAVRRTLLRTAADAIVIVVVAALVVGLVSWLLVQPLVVARGDRVERAAQASWDLPLMFIPGAHVSEWTMDTRTAGRTMTTTVSRYVGGQPQAVDEFGYRIGVTRFASDAQVPFLAFRDFHDGLPPRWQSDHVPDGTVATVQLSWARPVPLEDADRLVGPAAEASLLWAAFAIEPLRDDALTGAAWDPSVDVGYNTCHAVPAAIVRDVGRARSIGWTGTGANLPRGIHDALSEARRATSNLATIGDISPATVPDAPVIQRIDEVAAWLDANVPAVTSVVVTGTADAVREVVAAAGADDMRTLGITFHNWEGRIC